ncbi:hypothetical protein KF840_01405 [bacterium]|nr:hypothetical protein [bacterium]
MRVAVGRVVLLLDAAAGAAEPCDRCGRRADRMQCRLEAMATCLRCALDAVATDVDATLDIGTLTPVAPHAARSPHSGRRSKRGDAPRPSVTRHRQ